MVKAKVGELDKEVREGFYMRLEKDFTGVVQGVYVKRRFLVMFQDRCKKDPTLN